MEAHILVALGKEQKVDNIRGIALNVSSKEVVASINGTLGEGLILLHTPLVDHLGNILRGDTLGGLLLPIEAVIHRHRILALGLLHKAIHRRTCEVMPRIVVASSANCGLQYRYAHHEQTSQKSHRRYSY